jgi:AraC-like DNA-binding protein/mannose-6-phosphate isomerase-like protein (cupin superfamily)
VRVRQSHLAAERYFSTRFPLRVMDVQQEEIEAHTHEFWEMVYVRQGRGEHRIEEKLFPIQAGDLYVIAPGEHHAYAPLAEQSMRIVNVLWMPSLFDGWSGEANGAPSVPELGFSSRLRLSGKAAFRVESLLDEMRREQDAPGASHEWLMRCWFGALRTLLARESGRSEPRPEAEAGEGRQAVSEAIAWLEEHHARSVRVEDVAAHVALSPSRLSHLFKQHTGRGVIEYLHEFRVARAASLLCSCERAAQEIGAQVGFGDARFFHRVFRRHTGCSPTHFRRHFAPGGAAE